MVIVAAVAFLGTQTNSSFEKSRDCFREAAAALLARAGEAPVRHRLVFACHDDGPPARAPGGRHCDRSFVGAPERSRGRGELAAARGKTADAAERRLGELRLQLDEIGRDQTRFEHEIDSMTQKEKAEQTRMYDGSIANAKELEALQHEIASLQKRRSDREDELLAVMELREQLEAGAAEAAAHVGGSTPAVERVAGASDEELAAVDAELGQRTAERTTIAAEIEPDAARALRRPASAEEGRGRGRIGRRRVPGLPRAALRDAARQAEEDRRRPEV